MNSWLFPLSARLLQSSLIWNYFELFIAKENFRNLFFTIDGGKSFRSVHYRIQLDFWEAEIFTFAKDFPSFGESVCVAKEAFPALCLESCWMFSMFELFMKHWVAWLLIELIEVGIRLDREWMIQMLLDFGRKYLYL